MKSVGGTLVIGVTLLVFGEFLGLVPITWLGAALLIVGFIAIMVWEYKREERKEKELQTIDQRKKRSEARREQEAALLERTNRRFL